MKLDTPLADLGISSAKSRTQREALELRHRIEALGGLVAGADLARHWGMTTQGVHYLTTTRPDFPAPVAFIDGDRPLWALREADEWRARTRRRDGPRSRSAALS